MQKRGNKTQTKRREEGPISEFQEKVVSINRVAKVVKGGRRFNFSALVVVKQQRQSRCGFGQGGEVPEAIRKGVRTLEELVSVPLSGTTIPHELAAGAAVCC